MLPSSPSGLQLVRQRSSGTDTVYDAVVEFLRKDLSRARWMVAQHFPDHYGWCYHQGAHEQYRWPCQLFQCAQKALLASRDVRRLPPGLGQVVYPTLREVRN